MLNNGNPASVYAYNDEEIITEETSLSVLFYVK